MIAIPVKAMDWLRLRIFLRDLACNAADPEAELRGVLEQLEHEMSGRLQRDSNAVRLFTTTMSDSDVNLAIAEVCRLIDEVRAVREMYKRIRR